ncbi:RsiV family protein [Larsenimonas rhizosphaerae]|uniref:RsiV family protein n=1 Tax=Larsenimonas rhizosphaerae TaxID=2944682 RepID=A0AA41ZN06_9GAMM|nr:RsiV family protein [Larsenimonas rhizosphaerae]MCX2525251.1 RsiV family protein [Larsenimonas rhizosphaerae]
MMYRTAALLAGLVLLTGCQPNLSEVTRSNMRAFQTAEQWPGKSSMPGQLANLKTRQIANNIKDPDCRRDECPSVDVSYYTFPDYPALSEQLPRAMAAAAGHSGRRTAINTLPEWMNDFFRRAKGHPDWSAQLTANLLDSYGHLIVMALNSYEYQGGARGKAITRYANFDIQLHRMATLEDMLLPRKKAALDALVERAYDQWARDQGLDQDKHADAISTDNVALLRDTLMITYQAGEVAPYAMGQINLSLSYDDLEGILKPGYLPKNVKDDSKKVHFDDPEAQQIQERAQKMSGEK